MIADLELLYNHFWENQELAHWLGDEDLIQDYRKNVRFSIEKQDQLMGLLTGHELELFQCFLDNQLDRAEAECRMLFSQGFAAGLRLGALSAWG